VEINLSCFRKDNDKEVDLLDFNYEQKDEPYTQTAAHDLPVRSQSLVEMMPNLNLKEFYPSSDDVDKDGIFKSAKDTQAQQTQMAYTYCSHPSQNEAADLKQIKSQTYTSNPAHALATFMQQKQS